MTPADAMLIFVIVLSVLVLSIARYQDTHPRPAEHDGQ